jgi:hypothetical protein
MCLICYSVWDVGTNSLCGDNLCFGEETGYHQYLLLVLHTELYPTMVESSLTAGKRQILCCVVLYFAAIPIVLPYTSHCYKCYTCTH